jgi:hypothetical protein
MSDWSFVTCLARLGSLAVHGVVTGQPYEILSTGTWVHAEDLDGLLGFEAPCFCSRQGEKVLVRPFGRGNPTIDQLRNKPI